MNQSKQHLITVKIADADPFKVPVSENEESFYRHVIERINENFRRLHYGANGDTSQVALAKVALYYATMLYRNTELLKSQSELLRDFEARLDQLMAGTD